jgi:hypothetical protein
VSPGTSAYRLGDGAHVSASISLSAISFAAVPKHDIASMEHPLFSLSTRPDRRVLHYEHNGTRGHHHALGQGAGDDLHDKDILIFCISQLMAALNAGRAIVARS